MSRHEWMRRALCATADPEMFYSPEPRDIAAARRLCTRCPVRADCLAAALARGERFGVWGGTSALQRRHLRHRPAAAPARCTIHRRRRS